PLLAEIVRLELLVLVPAHLARHEEDPPRGEDPVRIPLGALPSSRLDGPKQTHATTSPPSTPNSCPVIPPAAGSARKTTARAISSGLIRRPMGFMRARSPSASSRDRPVARTMFSTAPCRRSVSVQPGQTAFTVIPFDAT